MAIGDITLLDTLQFTAASITQVAVEVRSGIIAVFFETPANAIKCSTFSYDGAGVLVKLDEKALAGIGAGNTVTSAIKISDGIAAVLFANGGFPAYPNEGMIATVSIDAAGIITAAVIDVLQYTAVPEVNKAKITHATGNIYAISFSKWFFPQSSYLTTLAIDAAGNIGAAALDTVIVNAVYREVSHVKVADGLVAIVHYSAGYTLETRTINGAGVISAVINSANPALTPYDVFSLPITGNIYIIAYRQAGAPDHGLANSWNVAPDGSINSANISALDFEAVNVPLNSLAISAGYAGGVLAVFYTDSLGAGRVKTAEIDSSGVFGAVIDTETLDLLWAGYPYLIYAGSVYIAVWVDSLGAGAAASFSVEVASAPTAQTDPATGVS